MDVPLPRYLTLRTRPWPGWKRPCARLRLTAWCGGASRTSDPSASKPLHQCGAGAGLVLTGGVLVGLAVVVLVVAGSAVLVGSGGPGGPGERPGAGSPWKGAGLEGTLTRASSSSS